MPTWGTLVDIFDGNWVDLLTFLVAVAYAVIQCHRNGRQKFISKETGLTVAHGAALFPLILLMGASLSSHALDALLHSHKIILSVAGAVALLAILEDSPPT